MHPHSTHSPVAVACITWLLSGPALWPALPAEFPALASHRAAVEAALPGAAAAFGEMAAWKPYFVRPAGDRAEL